MPRRVGTPSAPLSRVSGAPGTGRWGAAALGLLLALGYSSPSVADARNPPQARIVERLTASAEALARDAGTAPEGAVLGALMFYDPVRDLAGGVDGAAYGAGDRAWVEAALAVYDLYRQIGGEAGETRYLFRRDGARVFVALEGGAGAWHASMAQGQAAFLRLLARASRLLPESLRRAISRPGETDFGAVADGVAAVLSEPGETLLLPAGATRSLVIEDAWHVVGTPGLDVRAGPTDDGAVETRVARRPGEPAGAQAVMVYADGHRFTAKQVIEVATAAAPGVETLDVTAPRADAAPETDTKTAGRLDPTRSTPLADRIATSGGRREYTLSVPAVGAYAIRSTGPSDLVGVLKAPDGTVLARDDDGGGGYNFSLQATLQAGDYTLEVTHCCAGTGPFSLIVTPK